MGALLLALIYVCFISLGLPDSLLGSSWPVVYPEMGVPQSFAGIISTIISLGTIVSSLFSDRLQKKFGSGVVTAMSVVVSAIALFGFSVSSEFWMLVLWSIPYGLGAGGIDAILNNYVALHYKPQHMSWLHCFWGVGASISPYIMSFALVGFGDWSKGYLFVAIIQIVLSAIVFASIPLWRKSSDAEEEGETSKKALSLKEIFRIPGAAYCFILFFCYCSLESVSLWVSTYLVDVHFIEPELAASFASLFYIGVTVGRGINGFLAMKWKDKTLIRMGMSIIGAGILLLLLPLPSIVAFVGFIVIGLGCAPIYPCIIHMTPEVFGKENSQAMIGVQMASAYIGYLVVPPVFGLIGDLFGMVWLPVCLIVLLGGMLFMHESLLRKRKKVSI